MDYFIKNIDLFLFIALSIFLIIVFVIKAKDDDY